MTIIGIVNRFILPYSPFSSSPVHRFPCTDICFRSFHFDFNLNFIVFYVLFFFIRLVLQQCVIKGGRDTVCLSAIVAQLSNSLSTSELNFLVRFNEPVQTETQMILRFDSIRFRRFVAIERLSGICVCECISICACICVCVCIWFSVLHYWFMRTDSFQL